METLEQLAFLRIANNESLLERRDRLPLFLRRLLEAYVSDADEFRTLYRIREERIHFTVDARLNFDSKLSIKKLRKEMTLVRYFGLCAKYALVEEAKDTWNEMTARERVEALVGGDEDERDRYTTLQLSPMVTEATILANLGRETPWFFSCGAVYSAKAGWKYAMERNFDLFSDHRQLYDEKAVECCLWAVKENREQIWKHLLHSPKFESSFANPQTFHVPCRQFDLAGFPRNAHPDPVLVANLLALSLEEPKMRHFTSQMLDWCLDRDYEDLRDFVLRNVEEAELKEKAIFGIEKILSEN